VNWREMDATYVMSTYRRAPVVLVKGKGVRVWDSEGKEYLDFLSGIGVNILGHCHPKVVEAVRKQAGELIHCSNLYHIPNQAEMAKLLCEASGMGKVFFCNSGAEANEGAIKLARKYHRAKNSEDRYEIISFSGSFHGRTLATLAATGQTHYQVGFGPMPEGFTVLPFNDIEALRSTVGPKTAAILVEPVQGEGGVNVADPEFIRGMDEIRQETGVLLIFDEIQCGLGRTGKLFAWQHFGVKPDIMTLAKGLGGGVAMGAVLSTLEAAAFSPGEHASTFGGNPLATAAGKAALEVLIQENLPGHAMETGGTFLKGLAALKMKHSSILELRGLGMMLGVKLAFPGAPIVDDLASRGLLANCTSGDVLRFLPPLIAGEEHVAEALAIIDRSLTAHQGSNVKVPS